MLQAGYLEEWRYNATLSGAPQGGIISPILSNIYLDKFDKYIEQVLMPTYTKGDKRKDNIPYHRLISLVYVWRKKGKRKEANALRKQAQRLPAFDPTDPDYRRLKYVRYADDWCIGYIGTKAEAIEIKNQIRDYLHKELGLTLSEEKTLITHAKTETARFLGYHISIMQENTYRTGGKKRNANGKVKLSVPPDALKQKCQKYQRRGKPIHRPELANNTVYSIVAQYQSEYRGVVEYYQLANDIYKFNRLKWIMETSLTKTLAAKLKLSVPQVYKRFQVTHLVEGRPLKGLQVVVPREGKKPLIAKWGGIPLKRKPQAILNDHPPVTPISRSELEKRLLADTCELCGSHEQITVHHVRALKDLDQPGRREKPLWMKVMSARKRKTLVVCWSCHRNIHAGRSVKIPKNTN